MPQMLQTERFKQNTAPCLLRIRQGAVFFAVFGLVKEESCYPFRRLRPRLSVALSYQRISAKACYLYESFMNFPVLYRQRHPMPLPCYHSGAFMLSTMLICRTCRRMAKQTTTVNSIVNATASR